MRRSLRKHGGAIILAAMVLAAAGLACAIGFKIATNANAATSAKYVVHQSTSSLSGYKLKRVKANVDKTAWEYKLTLTLAKNISTVKLAWSLPKGMHARRVGGKFLGTSAQPYLAVKNLRVGQAKTVTFWTTPKPPNLASRCFSVRAKAGSSPSQTVRACLPKAPKGHSGPDVLNNFYMTCYGSGVYPNCTHSGVIKVNLILDNECGACYPYPSGNIPMSTVFYVTNLADRSDVSATFSTTWHQGQPKPTKKDLSLNWQMVDGVMRPVWVDRHLGQGMLTGIHLFISIPTPPAQVCISATATPLVWLPPIQSTPSHWCINTSG